MRLGRFRPLCGPFSTFAGPFWFWAVLVISQIVHAYHEYHEYLVHEYQ